MSSTLRIAIQCAGQEDSTLNYVGRLRDITPGRPNAARTSVRSLILPVSASRFEAVQVDPGLYLVEATAPSGEVITSEVEVEPGFNETQVMLVDDSASPREWLSWQKASGNIERLTHPAYVIKTRRSRLPAVLFGGLVILVLAAIAIGAFWLRAPGPAMTAAPINTDAVAPLPAPPAVAPSPTDVAAPNFTAEEVLESAVGPTTGFTVNQGGGGGGGEKFRAKGKNGKINKVNPKNVTAYAKAESSELQTQNIPQNLPHPPPPPSPPPVTATPAEASGAVLPPPAPYNEIVVSASAARMNPALWLVPAGLLLALAGGAVVLARRYRLAPAPAGAEAPIILTKQNVDPAGMKAGLEAANAAAPDTSLLDAVLPSGKTEWEALTGAFVDAAALRPALAKAPAVLQPAKADEAWRTYALAAAPEGVSRWAISFQGPSRAEAVKLPTSWTVPDDGTTAQIEVASAVSGERERLSGAVRDPHYSTLLGYLASGRIAEAKTMVDSAEDALFGKVANPYLAAAGGYVLIAANEEYGEAPWRDWITNLDQLFPWLPDGAVLQGVNLIQARKAGYREKFLEAVARGVPVYTEGLRRLRDGLTYAASDEEDEAGPVHAALNTVLKLSARCDPQQIFTTLRLGRGGT